MQGGLGGKEIGCQEDRLPGFGNNQGVNVEFRSWQGWWEWKAQLTWDVKEKGPQNATTS